MYKIRETEEERKEGRKKKLEADLECTAAQIDTSARSEKGDYLLLPFPLPAGVKQDGV